MAATFSGAVNVSAEAGSQLVLRSQLLLTCLAHLQVRAV